MQTPISLAKLPIKTHSPRIRIVRSIKISQVSLRQIGINVSSKVTKKLPSVIRMGVSTRSTATLTHLKIQAIPASVDSMRMPSRDTSINKNKWRERPSSSGESMSITRRCDSSRKIIGRVIPQTSSNGDRALDIMTRLIRRSNNGWETSAWIRFRRLISPLVSWDFCLCTWPSYLCGKCSSGQVKEKISRWTIISRWCYKRGSIVLDWNKSEEFFSMLKLRWFLAGDIRWPQLLPMGTKRHQLTTWDPETKLDLLFDH